MKEILFLTLILTMKVMCLTMKESELHLALMYSKDSSLQVQDVQMQAFMNLNEERSEKGKHPQLVAKGIHAEFQSDSNTRIMICNFLPSGFSCNGSDQPSSNI